MQTNAQSKIAKTLKEEARAEAIRIRKMRQQKWLQRKNAAEKRERGSNRVKKQEFSNELVIKVDNTMQNNEWVTVTRGGKGNAKNKHREKSSTTTSTLVSPERNNNRFCQLMFPELDGHETNERPEDRGDFQSPRPATNMSPPARTWASVAIAPPDKPTKKVMEKQVARSLFTITSIQTPLKDAWEESDGDEECDSLPWIGTSALKNGSWADECESDDDE